MGRMHDEISLLDATDQAALVRRGDLKPQELVEGAIARAQRLDPQLGAIVTRQFERARAEAASPQLPSGAFRGVPYLQKDLGAYLDGDPLYAGMAALVRAGWCERGDSHFGAKLRAAGLVSLGHSASPELGILPTTEPAAFGPARNPWRTTHSPGGSSGGSAAAVAAGVVAVAHASDGGGSIRIPASHCGLVGLKPSRARSSFGPALGERWGGCSVEGFVTRSVRDSAALLDLVAGAMPGDPYAAAPPERPYAREVGADPGRLRIGLMQRAPRDGELDPECRSAALAAARLLEALGHTVEIAHPPALDDPEAVKGFLAVVSAGVAVALDAAAAKIGRALVEDDVEPLTWAVAQAGRAIAAPVYVAAVNANHAQGRRLAGWWAGGFDLLLTPTCAKPPPPLGHFDAPPDNPLVGYLRAAPYGAFTMQFNISGQPAISLPLHWTPDGLPVGVQLVAAIGREDLLLRVAAQLEEAAPWSDRLPPLHASSF
jgi:amidase